MLIRYGKIIKYVLILVVFAGLFFAGRCSHNAKLDSLESIIQTEQMKTKVWKDNSSLWHSKAQVAELKSSEALTYLAKVDQKFADISNQFEGVRKDLKNVQYLGFTGTQSTYTIHTGSKDTLFVIGHDTTKAHYINYVDSTGWFSVNGIMLNTGDIPFLNFRSKDSLVTVLTRKRRLFRKTIYNQEIKSYNPHTNINYNNSIFLNKRKRFLGLF